ncbi:CUB and sushi domain-containing protein 3 [Orchesella cincta]|uniref:CUB and sushi domain-containing protein 3 n=1 Tax=Orchesella cincta TaxID=48709 RepID=A0A1D2MPG8_ORCCI|nr:CUB and sushi domain-containing protein 3 [Orchesella cincta]
MEARVAICLIAVAIFGQTQAATVKHNKAASARFVNTTSCGGLITAEEGLIEYKLDANYGKDERCIWTIRTPLRTGINFTMNRMGFEAPLDGVKLWSISKYGISRAHYFSDWTDTPEDAYVDSTVAIVTFHSIFSIQGQGFSLSFKATPDTDYNLKYYQDYNKKISGDEVVSFRYPENAPYRNLELSTFIVSRHTEDQGQIEFNLTSLELDYEPFVGECHDVIHAYYYRSGISYNDLSRITPLEGVCHTSQVEPPIYHPGYLQKADAIIILLTSDEQNTSEGYEVSYKYVN